MNSEIHLFLLWIVLLVSKKSLLIPRSQKLSPVFSSRSFIAFKSKLRSMFYFELILHMVQGVGWGSCFWGDIQLCMICNCSITICWKDYAFPLNYLCTFVKTPSTIYVGSFSGLFPVALICVSVLFQHHIVVITAVSQEVLKTRQCNLLTLFFFKIDLVFLGPLHFHINFTKSLSKFWLWWHWLHQSI